MVRQPVCSTIDGNIAFVEISNEEKKNALSYDLLVELKRTFQQIEDDDAIRAVVISGRGDCFCSGLDIDWLFNEDAMGMRRANRWLQEVFGYLDDFRKPVIGAVHGMVLGAGLVLALSCDLRVASTDAVLGLPEVKLGIPLFLGVSKTIQRYVGLGKTKELFLTGRRMNAQEGMELGFITRVVEKHQLLKEATNLAQEISMLNPVAVEIIKGSLNVANEMSEKSLMTLELDSLGFFWETKDGKRGIESFMKERKLRPEAG